MPDTIVAPDDCYAQLLDFHDASGADLSLGVFPTGEPESLAPVLIEPGSHRVLAIVDKPEIPPVANTWGIAAWSPLFTELLHDYVTGALRERERELLLSDVFVAAMTAGLRVRALAFESGEYHDIGTPAGVVRVRARLETAGESWLEGSHDQGAARPVPPGGPHRADGGSGRAVARGRAYGHRLRRVRHHPLEPQPARPTADVRRRGRRCAVPAPVPR
jgi:dTDP-glucose pyrophosphorylase